MLAWTEELARDGESEGRRRHLGVEWLASVWGGTGREEGNVLLSGATFLRGPLLMVFHESFYTFFYTCVVDTFTVLCS